MVTHCNSIRALWYEMPAKLQTNEQCSSKKTRQYRTIKHTRVYQFSICPWWCAGHMTSAQRIQDIRELQFRKSPSQIVLAAGQRRFLPLWNSSFLGFLKSCQQKQQQTHSVAWEDLEQTAEMLSSPPNPLPELYHLARWTSESGFYRTCTSSKALLNSHQWCEVACPEEGDRTLRISKFLHRRNCHTHCYSWDSWSLWSQVCQRVGHKT